MRLGLLSDTHGHLGRVQAAAAVLAAQDVGAVLHCGDIGTSMVLVELSLIFEPRGVPIYAVLGNVDLYNIDFAPFNEAAGVEVLGTLADLTLDGHRLAVTHGHDTLLLRRAIADGEYEYVFTGHTHMMQDDRHGATRVINPGAVYRAGEPSVAVLDLDTDDLTYLSIANT